MQPDLHDIIPTEKVRYERKGTTQHSTVTKGVVIVTSGLLFEFQMNEHSEEPVCVSRGLIKKADTLTHKE